MWELISITLFVYIQGSEDIHSSVMSESVFLLLFWFYLHQTVNLWVVCVWGCLVTQCKHVWMFECRGNNGVVAQHRHVWMLGCGRKYCIEMNFLLVFLIAINDGSIALCCFDSFNACKMPKAANCNDTISLCRSFMIGCFADSSCSWLVFLYRKYVESRPFACLFTWANICWHPCFYFYFRSDFCVIWYDLAWFACVWYIATIMHFNGFVFEADVEYCSSCTYVVCDADSYIYFDHLWNRQAVKLGVLLECISEGRNFTQLSFQCPFPG